MKGAEGTDFGEGEKQISLAIYNAPFQHSV